MKPSTLLNEFDNQIKTLLLKGYPTNITQYAIPLRKQLTQLSNLKEENISEGCIPFVVVVKDSVLPVEVMMQKVEKDAKNGVVSLRPLLPNQFAPLTNIKIPDSALYLLIDIDRGKKTLNVPPQDALLQITAMRRLPLTIEEGIAIITHYPEFLKKNNCFSLLGSRTGTDKRVPAIWVNAKKQPNLGWCWDGNPHTWLGSASCSSRVGS